MSHYRIYIIFFLVMGAGLGLVFLVSSGYYPIALVGGNFISAKQFIDEYNAATAYYENFLKTYGGVVEDDKKLSPLDLQLAVINGLIEKKIIAKGARHEAGEDFGYLMENKLAKISSDVKLENAAAALYGFSMDNFMKHVLIPQVEREILAGRLFLRGEDFNSWLLKTKESARVTIFSSNFKWTGSSVEAN